MNIDNYQQTITMKTFEELSNHYSGGQPQIVAPNRGTGYSNGGGDMVLHGYTKIYEEIFKDSKDSNINYLEVGVFQGRKLATFSDYFPNGKIYGVDLSVKEFELMKSTLIEMGAFSNNNLMSVLPGDSTDISTWDQKINDYPMFDIILDDGLHRPDAQHKTLINFWNKLKPGGIYIIEDIQYQFIDKLIALLKSTDHFQFIQSRIDTKVPNHQVFILQKESDE